MNRHHNLSRKIAKECVSVDAGWVVFVVVR